MVAKYDSTWEQGEDFVISIRYTEDGSPVDLTGYNVRMDMANGPNNLVVFTINSADVDYETDQPGPDDNEASVDADGNIRIVIKRAVTLPGGVVGDRILSNNKFTYDLFLRDPQGLQRKLMEGAITVNRSVTLWP